MRPLGKKKTRYHVEGHQDCGICRPDSPNKAREKENVKKEIKEGAAEWFATGLEHQGTDR